MIKAFKKLFDAETGSMYMTYALVMVFVGSMILGSVAPLMSVAAKSGLIVERKNMEFYSASSGIEVGLWRIKEGGSKLPSWMVTNVNGDSAWLESTFTHDPPYESYTLSSGDPVNGKTVVYKITPLWPLGEGTAMVEQYNSVQKRNPAVNIAVYGDYNGTGSVSGRGSYKMDIVYPGGDGTVKLNRIGCWLPPGLEYVAGSSSLETTETTAIQKEPVISDYKGGHLIKWDYDTPVDYNEFLEGQMSKATVTFEYTPNIETQGEFSWIKTDKTDGVNYLAWDTKIKMYEIRSEALTASTVNTAITAYSYAETSQPFGSSMEGDYWAFGNTLMDDSNSNNNRDRLYKESSSTVNSIPANATIKFIYLYWSGWKCKPWSNMGSYTSTQWADLCVDKKVDRVKLQIAYPSTGSPQFTDNITAYQKRGAYDYDHGGWSYACFADITDAVKNTMGSTGFVGNGKYTVGHCDTLPISPTPPSSYRYNLYDYTTKSLVARTPYPLGSLRDGGKRNLTSSPYYENYGNEDNWAYAAWSIIIIYSSPSTSGHMLSINDSFSYLGEYKTVPKQFSGFCTPPLTDEANSARYTHFVGEGDSAYNEGVTVKGSGTTYTLTDSDNPSNSPANNKCRIPAITDPNPGTIVNGIDIDTFNIPKTSIKPGDTEATVTFTTQSDSMNLVYMILSFRSKYTPGGISIYRLD